MHALINIASVNALGPWTALFIALITTNGVQRWLRSKILWEVLYLVGVEGSHPSPYVARVAFRQLRDVQQVLVLAGFLQITYYTNYRPVIIPNYRSDWGRPCGKLDCGENIF